MAQYPKFPGRDKRRNLIDRRSKHSSHGKIIIKTEGNRVYALRDLAMNDFRTDMPEIFTKNPYNKKKKQRVSISFKNDINSSNNTGEQIFISVEDLVRKTIYNPIIPIQRINILEYGNWDENPEAARTSHLSPIIDFIKDLGYKPLAEEFIFDKSGFGQYMFNNYPDKSKMIMAIRKGVFPISKYIDALKQGKKSILLKEVATCLRSQFNFPASIEVGDNGFVYDNGNAIQVGFSNLLEHPMLRKRV